MSGEPQATDLSEDLTKAAMWGNLKLLESLLENGADPNFPNGQGNSALHEAAYYGETECASVLLSFKASVNAPGADGKTPLHKAVCGTCVLVPGEKYDSEARIQDNQMDIVRLLVAHGADLNITDDSGLTPRDLAMQCDFYDCADLLDELEQLQAKVLEDRLKETRVQGLFGACESGNLETLKELLPYAMEAINDFLGGREENLFMCAARNGHLKLVEYLLRQGAVAVASPTTNMTALHLACEEGHTDVAICLLNCLPALLAIDDSPKETSLHIAARKGHVEIVRNLLAVAARSEVLKSADSTTELNAFLTNTVNERIPMNESLPEMVIDVMARSVKDQKTPLHEAAANGHTEIVRLLVNHLKEYASPKSQHLASPAIANGGRAIVGGFSPRHTDTTSTPLSGNSPASGSTKKGAVIIPGIDIMTLRGRTAFHEASKQGHFETMEVLLQSGADINAYMRPSLAADVNVELTALVQACLMNRLDVVRFLLRHGASDARLKALTRTLRVPNNEIAGVLLCYNGGVQQVPIDRTKKKATTPTEVCKLNVSWNSKSLKYICKDWLEMAIIELPSLSNKSCVLSTLDISSNQLSELPIEVFQLPYLSQLDISRNQIKHLPLLPDKANSGWTCAKLTQIDATSNQLSELPSRLFTLSELKEISANKNKISEVPVSVWSAPKLQRLTLAHNQLVGFPSSRNATESVSMTPWDNSVASPLDYSTQSPPGVPVQVPNYRSPSINQSDSGYQSDPRYGHGGSISLVESPIQLPLPYGTGKTPNIGSLEPRAQTIQTKAMMSRRLESFHDMDIEVEEFDDFETNEEGDSSEVFMLEVLDLSHNSLSAIPAGLSCLAPKLQKLNIAHNQIKSLGTVTDFPVDLDQFDASSNELHTAIAPSLPGSDHRYYQPCGRRHLEASNPLTMSTVEGSTPSFQNLYKPCPHRSHKNLRKLTTLKLNNNHLVDLQLFRFVGRNKGPSDLTSSFEESTNPSTKIRSNTVGEHHAVVVHNTSSPRSATLSGELFNAFTKSFVSRRPTVGKKSDLVKTPSGDDSTHHVTENGKSPDSSNSNSSQEGSGSGHTQTASVVISPLFPQLSTLELSKNRLRHVPSHIHLMTNIACLVISQNKDIDTLPLELSNLEHLWNLEYDGCPLTNPPAEDLDKFRLASDKLLYMRSLLHDAKPNESMKLMLVGLQRMGKTTLLSRLREIHEKATPSTTFIQRVTGEEPPAIKKGKRTDTLSTVGVDVGIWKYRKDLDPDYLKIKKRGSKPMRSVTFYTWDFGGQEEYYVTHQCFLSTRSLYLAVWDVTNGESGIEELGPWLHNIQARAPDSPVVIVGTHCDKLKSDEREKRKKELNHVIYQKYLVGRGPQQLKEMGLPKILDVIYVGCPLNGRAEGVPELRMALYDISFSLTALRRIGHGPNKTKLLDQPIPASFLKIQDRVQQMVAKCRNDDMPPLLKETVFRESVQDIIANPRELDQAVKFLHENGIMLHYDTPALSHLYFVDPQWLCDMLAHVVTVPEVNRFIQRNEGPEAGILRTSVLSHVFKGNIFPQAHKKEYIELLGKFEVALYLDRHRLLVPSMLPLKPAYTIHTFKNVFPRPSLCQILAASPETSRLFGRDHQDRSSDSQVNPEDTQPSKLAVATHVSEDLFRTGFIFRRFYFMTYVPSGFWPRLISRFLASTDISGVVLKSLGYDGDKIAEISEQIISGGLGSGVSLEWSYWKTGIEFWYKGLSLLRVTEILPQGSFQDCKPSPSIFEHSSSVPIEPCNAADDLSFELNGSWMPVDMTPNRGIEILVTDTVCLAMLHRELEEARNASSPYVGTSPDPRVESCDQSTTYPSYESHWMSAEIFSLAVDYIDTLLEDWYPGLGGRDGNTTIEAIPYVNRVIPCPFCVSGATPHPEQTPTDLQVYNDMHTQPIDISDQLSRSAPKPDTPISSGFQPSALSDKHKGTKYQRQNSGAKRALFNGGVSNRDSMLVRDSSDSGIHHLSTTSTFQPSSAEGPSSQENTTKRIKRKGSLADVYRTQQSSTDNEDPLAVPLESVGKTTNAEMGLTLASKFGFMLESCIVSARKFEPLVCPAHRDHPLPIRDIAPDLIFADLPSYYVLNPDCVDMGEYIDHGTFGDIYHGRVYPTPSATDDEGREVAIKIDRLDSKLFTTESALKAYIEVRAEVSILHRLHHPNVIEFIGVVLQPLCFILEWAHGGSLSSVFQKYRKVDARIAPMVLQNTAYQVASGLTYLHKHKIVYYDLKSPNILVFRFPSAQESLQSAQGHGQSREDDGEEGNGEMVSQVHVKIADLGISQALSPGGVMGFKGSPGFMAPEILKYVGTEACTEKVDIFSYAMFLYEMISLYFPFEKQNLMGSQIEKLVTEGERPPLQSRELNNPILYLDVMRWCWQQDFRNRPSAEQLSEILANPSISRLVDARCLHHSNTVTCACICTLPIEIVPPTELTDPEQQSFVPLTSTPHSHVTRGDLQEELWLCTHSENGSEVCVINFKEKSAQSFPVCSSMVTSICCVSYTMWLGTEEGQVFILDAVSKHTLLDRQLAVLTGQGICGIYYLLTNRQVLVTRRDGCVLLFNETIEETKLPDDSCYDNRVNGTQLPVRSVFKTPEKLPILCSTIVHYPGENRKSVWCGTKHEILLVFDVYPSQIQYCRKKYNRSRYDNLEEDCVASITVVEEECDGHVTSYVWALSRPGNVFYCWNTSNEQLLTTVNIDQFTTDEVSSLHAMGSQLQLALTTGQIVLLNVKATEIVSSLTLAGHVKNIYQTLSIGGRILPRHWLPSIIGRSNAIDFYKDLVDEKDVRNITSAMIGHQTRLLVTIGYGYRGLADRLVEPLMSPKDYEENFVLLWTTDR